MVRQMDASLGSSIFLDGAIVEALVSSIQKSNEGYYSSSRIEVSYVCLDQE